MEQERELDRALSQRLMGRVTSAPGPLAPLLAAANALTPLRQAAPSAAFARELEARMLRRARQVAAENPTSTSEVEPARPERVPPSASSQRAITGAGQLRRTPSARRLLWAGVIAATLLFTLGGVFVVAADAQPGGPLYGVRRFEQNVQAQLTTNAVDRTQLHLDNAAAALEAFNTAVAQHEHGTRLTDALDTFVAEHTAAQSALADVTDSAAHARLATALDGQRTQATTDLRTALTAQDWSVRLRITLALGALGVAVPVVTQVTLSEARDPADSRGAGRITTVTITGQGFQAGAQVLLRGAPAGTTISVSGDTIIAQVRAAAQAVASQGPIAVGNPDGTTAVSNKDAVIVVSSAHPTPSAEPTKNGDHGKPKGTPTP
ncbi:MAG TPA: IPT/TIG domain-containing protein [Ktedonobacterales bacterium]|jgi:hypothetical protein|nr:IPT/TIG domain-containing protein [Ktedonobacterales bacterium]